MWINLRKLKDKYRLTISSFSDIFRQRSSCLAADVFFFAQNFAFYAKPQRTSNLGG